MGDIIDTEKIDVNVRCQDVKVAVIYINLIGAPMSFLALAISIIRMYIAKKRKTFLTYLIILIFFSEIINTISKMIQLLKYAYDDERGSTFDNSVITARGVICQIQIFLSIVSDMISLLGTLLLSIRCYDVMRNKKFFDRKKVKILSICIIIITSIIFSITMLLIDRHVTKTSLAYKYDRRDRCSYWCWLCHNISLTCYSFYLILVVLNVFYACKTIRYFKKSYMTLLVQSEQSHTLKKSHNMICQDDNNAFDSEQFEKLKIMRFKCYIYPSITNAIWVFLTIYRITDDIIMKEYDDPDEVDEEKESGYFKNHSHLQRAVEAFLVFHTLFSALRGLLYSLSFIIFEEKKFKNCIKKCVNLSCCFQNERKDDLSLGNEHNNEIIRNTGSSLVDSKNVDEENMNDRKTSLNDYGKNNDMNTSDYHYND